MVIGIWDAIVGGSWGSPLLISKVIICDLGGSMDQWNQEFIAMPCSHKDRFGEPQVLTWSQGIASSH